MLNLDMDLLRAYHKENPNDENIDVAKKVVDAVFGNKPLSTHRLLCGRHFIDNLITAYDKEIEYHTAILNDLNNYLGIETKDAIKNTTMIIDEILADVNILKFVEKCICTYTIKVANGASIICANLPSNMTDEQLTNVCGWLKDTYSDRIILALEKLDMHKDFVTKLSKAVESVMKRRFDKEPET